MEVTILSDLPNELIALAHRLQGEVKNASSDRIEFFFAIATFGEQFVKASVWYSEFNGMA